MSNSNPYDVTQDQQGDSVPLKDAAFVPRPERIGRYRIERLLGKGGFGLVYLARDEQLDRPVAVKVPHSNLIARLEDAETYLAEARTVANLDHAHIVPVFDVGSTDDYPCYVVSKYIEGIDLSTKLRQQRLRYSEAAALVATVAKALHYAHKQGLVHRDVKPGNILIGTDGKPYVLDFGLALREENIGKGPKYAGTPAYMSPEQARGEGHRVDGRSDIFSLGVVFYELLVGRQPFRGESKAELMEQVTSCEARPLRQYDDHIPKELERICHKAMAKRAGERYSTASDLAEDLDFYVKDSTSVSTPSDSSVESMPLDTVSSAPSSTSVAAVDGSTIWKDSISDSVAIRIVPKGLRSFDAHDADFFLELLPGPRDRDGLPDSLRFWKTRIEEPNFAETFSVGLMYGPSGCGKSSLVKAGLLPRLSADVISVYIEATPDETETRLLRGLHTRCPGLESHLGLKDSLAALRRGQGMPPGKKVLIVLDQFEQWLHAHKEEENIELVQALRQCDGGHVQCIILVRDDFWLAVSRFSRELEVRLLEGRNSVLVDLFEPHHAIKVLAGFGRAFGQLPEEGHELSKEQKAFLKESVRGLSEGGKVICVRVALFAEMMKGKPWLPATLKEMGGTEGVGIAFLEETFNASPEHRYHQKAARAVLQALLPDAGTDIKGEMKSTDELLAASAYSTGSADFIDLIRLLDSEIRLITPTDPEGVETDPSSLVEAGQKYYQLSHDYLVPSLREWLNRKQKETRRGRAELRLAERSAIWSARPENRHLPSFLEHASIRMLTSKASWTKPQREMMSKAGQVYGIRSVLVAALLVAALIGGVSIRNSIAADRLEQRNLVRAEGLVDALLNADISQVSNLVTELGNYRQWVDPLLREACEQAEDGSSVKLHSALALLPVDRSKIDYLREQLLAGSIDQFAVVREALAPHADEIGEALWEVAVDETQSNSRRFDAACALSYYEPADERWMNLAPTVVNHLTIAVPTLYLRQRLDQLATAKQALIPPLIEVFNDRKQAHTKQREIAATALADYLKDQPNALTDLILAANDYQEFSPLIDALAPHAPEAKDRLLAAAQEALPDKLTEEQRDAFLNRRSLAASALVQLGHADAIWPMLRHSPDPSFRSQLIHHLGRLQTEPAQLADALQSNTDVSVRRALIQALGGEDPSRIAPAERERLAEQLNELFVSDPDPGIHSAASRALRSLELPLRGLPEGEPAQSEEVQASVAKLDAEIIDIEARIKVAEQQLSVRQAVRERQLRDNPAELPASLSEGLRAHFPLDEAAGSETANEVTGQPSGTYQGPGTPDWVSSVVGQGLQLVGDGGHISAGDSFLPEWTDSFSYGCWFATADVKAMALVAQMDSPEDGHRGFDILINKGFVQVHIKHSWPDSVIKVVSSTDLADGVWHHVFTTYDGSGKAAGVRLFVDGKVTECAVALDCLSGSILSSVPLTIGSRGWGQHFTGQIDEVLVYDRLLGAEEIEQLYAAGVQTLAGVPVEQRTPAQQQLLSEDYRPRDVVMKRLRDELEAAEETRRLEASWQNVRRWYVNTQGQTFVILPRLSETGAPQLKYSFAMLASEVTLAQFQRFRKDHEVDSGAAWHTDCPVHFVSWFDAAAYCNWLNEKEGIPAQQWCYEPNSKGEYDEGMSLKADFHQLTGYRLPTPEEWDYACRANSTSRYFYGESIALLNQYGWHGGNSGGQSYPVESLLPNGFGLFDMHGNLWEWSQNELTGSEALTVSQREKMTLCGGAYSVNRGTTSRITTEERPVYRGSNIGFRPVRSLPHRQD